MEQINIDKAIERDEHMKEGLKEYQSLEQQANAVAEELSTSLIESIVKEEGKFNISTAMLAVAKTLTHLSSFLYDTEEEFLADVKKARTCVVSDIIPTLLDPQPCGLCYNCKDGKPEECINPSIREDYTSSRFLPVLSNMLIEYDLFNKILHMYTAARNNNDEAIEKE